MMQVKANCPNQQEVSVVAAGNWQGIVSPSRARETLRGR